MITQVSQY